MIIEGDAPFLECSSKGDRRFSAFFAKIKKRGWKSIEEIYQSSKRFENGLRCYNWRDAKGRKPVNLDECKLLYSVLWDEYFDENPDLLKEIMKYRGFTDMFGESGSVCQATEIYRKYMENGGS